ncbi:MAG: hypothetical protein H5U29_08890 [Pusillimonas sp.]|nr:hypothetical protein [Pusillimonas sp.]
MARPAAFFQEWDYEVLKDHNFIPIQSILFKRELFELRGGFDRKLEQLEDWNLWLRYGLGSNFLFIPKTTSLFRSPAKLRTRISRVKALQGAYETAKSRATL